MPFSPSEDIFAAVRYGDRTKEVLNVRAIKRFYPTHLKDFCPLVLYSIKTNRWSKNKDFVYYRGVVEGLGVTPAGAECARKAFLKNLNQEQRDDINFVLGSVPSELHLTSDAEDLNAGDKQEETRREVLWEANNEVGDSILTQLDLQPPRENTVRRKLHNKENRSSKQQQKQTPQRESDLVLAQALKRKNLAHQRENADYIQSQEISKSVSTLAVTSSCELPPPISARVTTRAGKTQKLSQKIQAESSTLSASPPIPIPNKSETSANKIVPSKQTQSLTQSTCSLLPKPNNSEEQCSSCKNLRHEIYEMRHDINRQLEEFKANLLSVIQDRFGNHTSGNTAAESSNDLGAKMSYGLLVSGGKVNLGASFWCHVSAWVAMNTCDAVKDWCAAILCGTFGEEKAMLYRVSPRYTDLESFPAGFFMTASVHFTSFIRRRKKEISKDVNQKSTSSDYLRQVEFFTGEEKMLVKKMKSMLADKANNLYAAWRAKQSGNGIVLPPRMKRPSSIKVCGKTSKKQILSIALPIVGDTEKDDSRAGSSQPSTPLNDSQSTPILGTQQRRPGAPMGTGAETRTSRTNQNEAYASSDDDESSQEIKQEWLPTYTSPDDPSRTQQRQSGTSMNTVAHPETSKKKQDEAYDASSSDDAQSVSSPLSFDNNEASSHLEEPEWVASSSSSAEPSRAGSPVDEFVASTQAEEHQTSNVCSVPSYGAPVTCIPSQIHDPEMDFQLGDPFAEAVLQNL